MCNGELERADTQPSEHSSTHVSRSHGGFFVCVCVCVIGIKLFLHIEHNSEHEQSTAGAVRMYAPQCDPFVLDRNFAHWSAHSGTGESKTARGASERDRVVYDRQSHMNCVIVLFGGAGGARAQVSECVVSIGKICRVRQTLGG